MSKIIIALDYLSWDQCTRIATELGPHVHALKVHTLIDERGPGVIGALRLAGAMRVWVDAKLHDTPDTVRARTRALVNHGASIVSVHASGGVEMMVAAKSASTEVQIFAITALTSLSAHQIEYVYGCPVQPLVMNLARQAALARIDGVVCSSHETKALSSCSDTHSLLKVVPGIRSRETTPHSQKRTASPQEALEAGASLIVVGREITKESDPVAAFHRLTAKLKAASLG